MSSPPEIELRVVAGPQKSLSCSFNQPVITIGRHIHCDFRVDSEGVSRRHATIQFRDGLDPGRQLWLRGALSERL